MNSAQYDEYFCPDTNELESNPLNDYFESNEEYPVPQRCQVNPNPVKREQKKSVVATIKAKTCPKKDSPKDVPEPKRCKPGEYTIPLSNSNDLTQMPTPPPTSVPLSSKEGCNHFGDPPKKITYNFNKNMEETECLLKEIGRCEGFWKLVDTHHQLSALIRLGWFKNVNDISEILDPSITQLQEALPCREDQSLLLDHRMLQCALGAGEDEDEDEEDDEEEEYENKASTEVRRSSVRQVLNKDNSRTSPYALLAQEMDAFDILCRNPVRTRLNPYGGSSQALAKPTGTNLDQNEEGEGEPQGEEDQLLQNDEEEDEGESENGEDREDLETGSSVMTVSAASENETKGKMSFRNSVRDSKAKLFKTKSQIDVVEALKKRTSKKASTPGIKESGTKLSVKSSTAFTVNSNDTLSRKSGV